MKRTYRYSIVCEHKGRVTTIIMYDTCATNPTDALINFMSWHERTYPGRRAYNVVCNLVSVDISL